MSVSASSIDAIEDAIEGDATVSGQADSDADDTKRSAALQGIAKGSTPRGQMNNTERRWARRLDASEEVLWWAYEVVKFRYGDKGWATPDFFVMRLDGQVEVHETKSFCTDAGRTRFKASAKAMPIFRWLMFVQKSPKQKWKCRYDTLSGQGSPYV